jgi:hypothetical protein
MARRTKLERLPSEFDLGEVDPGSITVKLDDPEIVALMNKQTQLVATVTGGSRYLRVRQVLVLCRFSRVSRRHVCEFVQLSRHDADQAAGGRR